MKGRLVRKPPIKKFALAAFHTCEASEVALRLSRCRPVVRFITVAGNGSVLGLQVVYYPISSVKHLLEPAAVLRLLPWESSEGLVRSRRRPRSSGCLGAARGPGGLTAPGMQVLAYSLAC